MSAVIIGGADGPTAIFVNSSPRDIILTAVSAVLIAGAVTAIIVWRLKRRGK